MDTPFLARGDSLPELGPLTEASDDTRLPGLLWGVDLTRCRTRKQARAVWHDAVVEVKTVLDASLKVRRVRVASSRPRQFPHYALIREPETLALRIHNHLERDRGRYACAPAPANRGFDVPPIAPPPNARSARATRSVDRTHTDLGRHRLPQRCKRLDLPHPLNQRNLRVDQRTATDRPTQETS